MNKRAYFVRKSGERNRISEALNGAGVIESIGDTIICFLYRQVYASDSLITEMHEYENSGKALHEVEGRAERRIKMLMNDFYIPLSLFFLTPSR